VRLVFSVPVYALCSFPSLLFPAAAPYIAAVRDCYEAWIIYNFMALCLAYVGGAGASVGGCVLINDVSASAVLVR
jgi:hypothetical protein